MQQFIYLTLTVWHDIFVFVFIWLSSCVMWLPIIKHGAVPLPAWFQLQQPTKQLDLSEHYKCHERVWPMMLVCLLQVFGACVGEGCSLRNRKRHKLFIITFGRRHCYTQCAHAPTRSVCVSVSVSVSSKGGHFYVACWSICDHAVGIKISVWKLHLFWSFWLFGLQKNKMVVTF